MSSSPAMHICFRSQFLFLSLGAAAIGAGCGWLDGPLIWPGLEPVEQHNRAKLPGSPGDPFPETLGVARGEERDYDWVHARGWVRAPIETVWSAIRDPDVLVDRRRVAEWSTEHDVEPEVPVSFVIHHVVRDLITLEFDLYWRQAHVEGREKLPSSVWARGDLVSSSFFLSVLSTSIVLEAAHSDVTEIQLIRHIDAIAAGGDEAELYLWDLYESVLARVRGHSLPEY